MLKITDLHVTFHKGTIHERVALNNVSYEVQADDFITILGTNGAGKSTLLNCIAGNIEPDKGKIELDGIRKSRLGIQPRKTLYLKQSDQKIRYTVFQRTARQAESRSGKSDGREGRFIERRTATSIDPDDGNFSYTEAVVAG